MIMNHDHDHDHEKAIVVKNVEKRVLMLNKRLTKE